MNSKREEATALRDAGYSYNMINQMLGVPTSTMSYWFADRVYTPNAETIARTRAGSLKNSTNRHNQRVEQTKIILQNSMNEIGKLSKRDLWLLGLGLYIGEGSKSIESVRIVNSDPYVIKTMIKWFKDVCGLTNENLIISLNLYPDNDISEAIKYWHDVTKLPLQNFRKTQIDIRTNKNKANARKLKYGTAQIRVIAKGDSAKGVNLFRKIRGWTQGVYSQV